MEARTMSTESPVRTVELQVFDWEYDESDPDSGFKKEVADYTLLDPMPTVEVMSRIGIPIGVIVRYVLARWVGSGTPASLEIGPRPIQQMADILAKVEPDDDDDGRLEAYKGVSQIVAWLNVPLYDPYCYPEKARTGAGRKIELRPYDWAYDRTDKDANFKQEVVDYTRADPMPAVDAMCQKLDIPVGAIVRYALAKWANSGASSLLELGPQQARHMSDIVRGAEETGEDKERLKALDSLSEIVSRL